jgi:hypothetical protein
VASLTDLFSDFYTEMFGVLAWQPLAQTVDALKQQGSHRLPSADPQLELDSGWFGLDVHL